MADGELLHQDMAGGRGNEPAYLLRTAEAVANYRSMSVIDLARTTTENAKRVFQIL